MRLAVSLSALAFLAAGFSPLDLLKDAAELDVRQGIRALDEKRYDEARESFRRAEERVPDSPIPPFDRGAAAYRAEDFEEALEAFQASAKRARKEAELARDAHYNAGNALFKQGRYADAIQEYNQALGLDPQDEDAAFNKRLAEELVRRQQQQSSPTPTPQQGSQPDKESEPPGQGSQGTPTPQPLPGPGQQGLATPPRLPQRPNLPRLSREQADEILRQLEQRERSGRSQYDQPRAGDPFEEMRRRMRQDMRDFWGDLDESPFFSDDLQGAPGSDRKDW